MACRQAKKSEMAMIFMNRFLDLVEAIENDDGMLDPEGFEETEIPLEGKRVLYAQIKNIKFNFYTYFVIYCIQSLSIS